MTRRRWVFPLVHTFVFLLLSLLAGYYANNVLPTVLIGTVIGFGIGLAFELGFARLGNWVYRRRVLFSIVIELALFVFVVVPIGIIHGLTSPQQYSVCCIETTGLGDAVEAVRIPGADGVTLAGWYAPPTDGSGAVVIVLHGSRGNRLASLEHARRLHEVGFGVLVYDQRASGESTGDRQSLGWLDRRDLPPIIDWLSARPEVDAERIGGVGLSLGADILIGTAPTEPRLKAIWADGAAPITAADLPTPTNFFESMGFVLYDYILRLASLYVGTSVTSSKEAIAQIAPRPLMLVTGDNIPLESDVNRGYGSHLGENGELWVISGAGHTMGLGAATEEYTRRMIAFFDSALRGGSVSE